MDIPKGYAGRVAIIDLTESSTKIVPLEDFLEEYDIEPRKWLGGDGFIAKILWKDIKEAIDPLGPDNEVIITTGPWTATAAPQAGRGMLGCISPETGGFSSGSFGWFFPATLKYAGFDIVIVRGKAEKPSLIFIDNQEITIRDASHIWGLETGPTVKAVREYLGERYEAEIKVLSISVAGENLVKYAPPCTDGTSSPGRSGGGSVMGSKNLKAIAVRGTGGIAIDDPKGLLQESYDSVKFMLEEEPTMPIWKDHGCTTSLSVTARWKMTGDELPINRKNADFPHLNNVGCLNCFMPCYHWLQIKEGKYKGTRQVGGHMTFITNCVRNLGIFDFNTWIYYERLIQELGLDPASFSMAFTFAVDLYEQGIMTDEDTDGLKLKLGNDDLIWEVARRAAYREGRLGNLVADGVAEMARQIGKGAEEIAPHVKGKPSIQKDSKLQALIWSLGYLTSNRGGDWLRVHNTWELAFLPEKRDTYPEYIGMTNLELYEKALGLLDMPDDLKKQVFGEALRVDADWVKSTSGKALFTVWTENFVSLFNCLVTCMFGGTTQFLLTGFGPTTYMKVLNKITGWDTDYEELMEIGERTLNLQRLINYRLKGWDYRNDRFANKHDYEPGEIGIYRNKIVPWDETLQEYYGIRGWSTKGLPTHQKLAELGIDEIAKDLELPE